MTKIWWSDELLKVDSDNVTIDKLSFLQMVFLSKQKTTLSWCTLKNNFNIKNSNLWLLTP